MNIKLREWKSDDLKNLVRYANNFNIANNMTDKFPHPYSTENGEAFLDMVAGFHPRKILAIDLDGEAIGSMGVFQQDDIQRLNAEMGYWLAEPFWGKGIITKTIPMMVEYGFRTFTINRIFARPFGRNIASQRALEKCGFKLEAHFKSTFIKNGVLEDELVYAIYKS